MGSGALLKRAQAKYGLDNFRKAFLGYAESKEELQYLEWDHIQAEKAVGKAEYNLFTGPGAGGDTFADLKIKSKEEVRRTISKGLRSSQAFAQVHEERRAERLAVLKRVEAEHGDAIVSFYRASGNLKLLAAHFKLSVRTVREILIFRSEPLNIMNLPKEKRAATFSSITGPKPGSSLREVASYGFICEVCGEHFKSSRKERKTCSKQCSATSKRTELNISDKELIFMYAEQKMSVRTIAEELGLKSREPVARKLKELDVYEAGRAYSASKTFYEKHCPVCLSLFSTAEKRAINCSRRCAAKARRKSSSSKR